VNLYGSEGRARHRAWRRVSGYFAQAGGVREEKTAEHVSPVQGTGGRRYHEGADGSRADVPLRDGRESRGGGHGGEEAAGIDLGGGGRGGGGVARGESIGRQFAVGFAGVWAARGIGGGAACEANVGADDRRRAG